MAIIDGTNDAVIALRERAEKLERPFDAEHIGWRGSPADGGQTGKLVLLNDKKHPVHDGNGEEIAVPWCHTGGAFPNFTRLD